MVCVCAFSNQQSSTFFGTRDQFHRRQFFHGMVLGWFKCITFITHFMSNLKPLLIWWWVPVCGPEVGDPCPKWHFRWIAKTGRTLLIAVYWQTKFKYDCSAPCGVPGDGSGRQCLKPHPFACRTFRKLWISRSASPGALGDSWPLGGFWLLVLLPLWGPAGLRLCPHPPSSSARLPAFQVWLVFPMRNVSGMP